MMKRQIRRMSLMTAVLAAMLVFAFAGAQVYAADKYLTNDTTQLENGNRYYVEGEKTPAGRLDVKEGAKVRLNIRQGAKLWANHGIYVPYGSTLIIEGGGVLEAKGDKYCPGIGGIEDNVGGSIRINGERLIVIARGGQCAAGIGSALKTDSCCDIEIDAGTVKAYGNQGAGIGSGKFNACRGNITIRGGSVEAYSGNTDDGWGGAGIGGGVFGDLESKVTITGGKVYADGADQAAGIGGGFRGNAGDATVDISGGEVTAVGKKWAAGIGGGCEDYGDGGEGAKVNITGGKVTALSPYCAIGHGYNDKVMGDLFIEDNMKVRAGDDSSNLNTVSSAANRVDDCREYKNAVVEACDHPNKVYKQDAVEHTLSCQYCRTKFSGQAHEYEDIEGTAVEATCSQKGKSADQRCKVCGYAKAGDMTDFGNHVWGEWTVTKEATLEEEGEQTRVCQENPDHTETITIPKKDHEHHPALVSAEKATCETSGHQKYYKCTICDAMSADPAFETLITENDIRIPATGHKKGEPEKGEATESDCTRHGGYPIFIRCENCGKMLNVEYVDFPIDADAHDWSDWEVTKEATTTDPGEITRVCSRDASHVEIKYTPRLNPYRVADMIDNLTRPYDKAEVEEVCGAYKRLVEGGYSISNAELAKLQTAVDSLAKAETTTLKSVKAKKGKKALVQWKKNANVNGYQLYYKAAGTKAKTVTVNNNKTLKKTVKKLKAGKKYTFKVRTFSKVENLSTGKMKTVYSAWSKAKKVKAKK